MADKKISALTGASTPLAGTEVLPIVQSGTTVKVAVSDLTTGRAVSASDLTSGVGGTGNTTAYLRLQGSSAANYGPAVYAYRNGVNKWFIASESDYLGGSGDNPWIVSNGTTLNLAVASTGATAGFKLTSTNGTFTGINLTQGTAAKGINFTANTPAAGMTSQLLNWYEEGTYTATLTPSTSGTITVNSSNNTLAYTRIGRVVYVQGFVNTSSVSSPVGTTVRLNLPITAATLLQGAGFSTGSFLFADAPTYALTNYGCIVVPSGNYLDLIINAALVGSGDEFQIGFNYIAA